MTTSAPALAPIHKAEFQRSWRTDRMECWSAETQDGLWRMERTEDPGTPWVVFHLPSMADGSWTVPVFLCGTLRACREDIASGAGERMLVSRKAEAEEER